MIKYPLAEKFLKETGYTPVEALLFLENNKKLAREEKNVDKFWIHC